jgi:hypothetical protein
MTPEEFSAKVGKAVQRVQKELPDIIDQNALNQKALIRDRVTQKGLNVDASGEETTFPSYSEPYKKRKDKLQGSGTPNRLVLTGDMLRKLNIVGRQISDGKYTAVLGGSDAFSQRKLEYNEDEYHNILKPSNKEAQIMQDAYVDSVMKIINDELGR